MRREAMAAAIGLAMLLGGVAASADQGGLDQAFADYRRGDAATALAAFERLAAAEPEAAYWVGAIYEKGEGVPQDLRTAARWYARAADRGFPAAAFRLGLLLDAGQGVPHDRAGALKLYLAAAGNGHLAAMRAIGMAYEAGNGVEPSAKAALSWYRRAADRGDNESFNRARRLARAMSSDAGLSPVDAAFAEMQRGNQMRALGALLDAAEAGDAEAKAWLGFFYESGTAGPKDFGKAARYYQESAAGGSLKGKNDYATALLYSPGIPHDAATARRLLGEAAEGGFALAQFNLAFLEADDGGEPGQAAARRWYRTAGLLGYRPAWDELARLLGGAAPQPATGSPARPAIQATPLPPLAAPQPTALQPAASQPGAAQPAAVPAAAPVGVPGPAPEPAPPAAAPTQAQDGWPTAVPAPPPDGAQ